jgi:putative DNA primase/helicase
MTVTVDQAAVREFMSIISAHALKLTKGNGHPGVLQLCCLSPHDERFIPHRFAIDDVENITTTAITAANASLNVYLEARTVRSDLRGSERGKLEDTASVFALVVDADHDKGKGGKVTARPSLSIETSRGNFHYWYFFDQPVEAAQAKMIGDVLRRTTGADQDTGVVTQCYRVPGTPNFPSKTKQARGRTAVEPTRLAEWTEREWNPSELLAVHERAADPAIATPQPPPVTGTGATGSIVGADESSLPDELLQAIREGGVSKGLGPARDTSRSGLFHHTVGELKKRHWSIAQIQALFERYPNGVASKYTGRLTEAITSSYAKVENGSGLNGATPRAASASASPVGQASPGSAAGAAPGPTAGASGSAPPSSPSPGPSVGQVSPGPGANAHVRVLPTIRLRDGQLPRIVEETERALIASGMPIFTRAGALVCPVIEHVPAANGGQTVTARLREFKSDSFIEWVAKAAIYQRYNQRRKAWGDVDPPVQVVQMLLGREHSWSFPRVAGVITTPTLRADGSLLDAPGYDARTELFLSPNVSLPPMPARPSKDEARAALDLLKSLLVEFSFQQKQLDQAVALSGILTALLRGSLPAAPIYLVRASTPGTGKSYLVDVIAAIATGQVCPVISASSNSEESEKRIGAVLLSGSPIVSLDNLTHDLGSEILCQVSERPVVRIRVLGRSEMPNCECHTAMFATGNNVSFKGDMVRRGLLCNLETLQERPELREFKQDALARASADRATYVAAALTIVRAYLVAGAPSVCGAYGSYGLWSTMARRPLVWLGEPDPVASLDTIRDEDVELSNIHEFFDLWKDYLRLDTPYTTARLLEIANEQVSPVVSHPLKEFFLKVAARRGKETEISPERAGQWMRRISGRVVNELRLVREQGRAHTAIFRLVETT